jgi:hypothetical protein
VEWESGYPCVLALCVDYDTHNGLIRLKGHWNGELIASLRG